MATSLADSAITGTPAKGALSPKAAAVYLDTTEGTLAQWRHRQQGPPYARLGTKIVYRIESLDAYLREREAETMEARR